MERNKEEIYNWLRNKDIRVWKRALFLIYMEGEISNGDVANSLSVDIRNVRRTLTKLQGSSHPLVELKDDHKWHITPVGIENVEYGQKHDKFPVKER